MTDNTDTASPSIVSSMEIETDKNKSRTENIDGESGEGGQTFIFNLF